MTLEDRLRAYAAKGELVHLSLAFRPSDGLYHCNFAAASPAGGYASGADKDPVAALEKAFTASPTKRVRPSHKPKKEVTATVTEPEARADPGDASLPNDWTQP